MPGAAAAGSVAVPGSMLTSQGALALSLALEQAAKFAADAACASIMMRKARRLRCTLHRARRTAGLSPGAGTLPTPPFAAAFRLSSLPLARADAATSRPACSYHMCGAGFWCRQKKRRPRNFHQKPIEQKKQPPANAGGNLIDTIKTQGERICEVVCYAAAASVFWATACSSSRK